MNTGLLLQTVWPFTARRYSSRYFSTEANEPEVLHIYRKRLTSTLKNKVDGELQWWRIFAGQSRSLHNPASSSKKFFFFNCKK